MMWLQNDNNMSVILINKKLQTLEGNNYRYTYTQIYTANITNKNVRVCVYV